MINPASIELLDTIINEQQITCIFQPIFDLSQRRILGYEALSRGPKDSPLYHPETLFGYAQQQHRLAQLEMICHVQAIEQFSALGLKGKLFLNINPVTLTDAGYDKNRLIKTLLARGLSCRQVVIELTEQSKADITELLRVINDYRQLGFGFAIDDLGAGYCGLRMWSEIMPDVVKLDRYFIENCHLDVVKKTFLQQLYRLAVELGSIVVVEGIECKAELQLLKSIGFNYCQGFLLERPSIAPSKHCSAQLLLLLNDINHSPQGKRSVRPRETSFKTDSFKTDSFKTDSFKTDSFKTDSFKTDSFKTDSFKTDSFKSGKMIAAAMLR